MRFRGVGVAGRALHTIVLFRLSLTKPYAVADLAFSRNLACLSCMLLLLAVASGPSSTFSIPEGKELLPRTFCLREVDRLAVWDDDGVVKAMQNDAHPLEVCRAVGRIGFAPRMKHVDPELIEMVDELLVG